MRMDLQYSFLGPVDDDVCGDGATATAVDSMNFLRPQRNKYGRLPTVQNVLSISYLSSSHFVGYLTPRRVIAVLKVKSSAGAGARGCLSRSRRRRKHGCW